MSNEHLNNLANELKIAREKSKTTIDQIFTKTRIDRKYLRAIESGNFSVLPEVYIRAFIREYAKSVGLDPEEIIKKFDTAKVGKAYDDQESDAGEKRDSRKEKSFGSEGNSQNSESTSHGSDNSSGYNKSFYYLIGAVSLLLTIFIIYKGFLSEDDNTIVTEKPFEQIVENKEKVKSETNEIDVPSNSQDEKSDIKSERITEVRNKNENQILETEVVKQPLKKGEMTLSIFADDESWMRIVSDDNNNIEFTIHRGMTKVFYAKDKFYLHIGNSGGIKLYLNNKDIQFRGSPGKVRKVFITEEGIEYLRGTPVLNVEQEENL